MGLGRRALLVTLVAALCAASLPGFLGQDIGSTIDVGAAAGLGTTPDSEDLLIPGDDASPTTPVKEHSFKENAQKFEFQAEVNRLMDIIIHSLYTNADIFLRELISNASDALDKIRFLSLTDKSVLGEDDQANLEIRISVDPENKVLKIRDSGVGMTKDDLIKNLGTIAKSGTAAFLEQMQKGGDVNLIGQFGVGFYSVFLVADYVQVISKHNDEKQYIWESKADGNFAISEDTEGEPLGRGTQINLFLKEETAEYADEAKLKELVAKYSEFISFPIYLYTSKEVDVPAEEAPADEAADEEEEAADAAKDDAAEDDVEDESEDADDDEEEEEAAPKTVKQTVWDWELLNDNKALWLRNPADVSEEEYVSFYQSLAKNTYEKPATYTHFKAEGDVEFRSIVFIPETAPFDFLDNYYQKRPSIKLYVRRVFISDDMEELIPRFLSFVRGIVDSDTLPLSVSRETLQASDALKTIKKKVVRKILDIIRKMAEDEKPPKEEDEEEAEPADKPSEEDAGKYKKFWGQFGKAIKMGIIEDNGNRGRLSKLLRFHTSKFPDTLRSLEEYVADAKEGQKHIYYLAGQSQAELEKSPLLEQLLAKGYEVIYFTDAIDEYVMQNLRDFEGLEFQNASKDDLQLSDKDAKSEKKQEKKLKEEFKALSKWWKGVLGEGVEAVKVSRRLATSPCVVVTSKYSWSANMERIQKAQALGDAQKAGYMQGKKTLEINPRHPLVLKLKEEFEADADSDAARSAAHVLYDTALLESGFDIADPKDFNSRVHALMAQVLRVEGDLTPPPESEPVESQTAEEDAEDASEPSSKDEL